MYAQKEKKKKKGSRKNYRMSTFIRKKETQASKQNLSKVRHAIDLKDSCSNVCLKFLVLMIVSELNPLQNICVYTKSRRGSDETEKESERRTRQREYGERRTNEGSLPAVLRSTHTHKYSAILGALNQGEDVQKKAS